MPIDLRQYVRTANRDWMQAHEKRLEQEGKNLSDMISAIVKALFEIPTFKYLDIEKSVKPENREVFVKIACDFIDTFPDYRFNRLMNRVYNEPNEFHKQILARNANKEEQALDEEG